MTVFIIRRLMQAALVIFVMSVIVFVGISVVSTPVDILINPDFTQEEFERAVRALGLDRPLYEQYFVFLGNALRGDLGDSFVFGQPALELIAQRIPATMELAFGSLILSIVIGIPLGVFAGLKPDSAASKTIMAGSIFGFSLPTFWVGIMLIMIFAVELGWLPSTGRGDTVEVLGLHLSFLTWDGLQHLFLPALNLALVNISLVTRVARAGTREAALQDYVRFARAKGLSSSRIVLIHILKNIMIPIVTILGLELGSLIAFSVVTETIFAWPGMGKLLIDSINLSDRPIVVAYLMMIVCIFVVINLVVDVLYSVLDPRVRLQDVKQ